MKRCTISVGLLVALLISLTVAPLNGAQPGAKKWKHKMYRGHDIKYLPGFKKKSPCPAPENRTPEVVTLQLDDDSNFKSDPVAFMNGLQVFSCTVDKGLVELKAGAAPESKKADSDPLVTIIHDPDSGGVWYYTRTY